MTQIVPKEWMPFCKMKRVICHWTAGAHTASGVDKEHYHIIVEGSGRLVRGDHSISDNVNTADDDYAAHTRGCNTGSIGVSMCCMAGAQESPFKAGRFPMKEVQWERMVQAVADLCKEYKIAVTPQTVLSHAEVQGTLGIPQRGKWDFTILPFEPFTKGAKACGDRLRADVKKAMKGD